LLDSFDPFKIGRFLVMHSQDNPNQYNIKSSYLEAIFIV
jgi:hypothetical protein